jgi:sugar phosphate isomerase/epimerase
MPLGYNTVLGDTRKSAESRPHRVALGAWPASVNDPRSASIDALICHLLATGYEGVEFSVGNFDRYFPGDSKQVVADKARAKLEKAGLQNFGSTCFFSDEGMRKRDFLDTAAQELTLVKAMGGQYASYQLILHPDYSNTGGSYRSDERYLAWCAQVVTDLRELCWSNGLNFYLEVHMDRFTEDPAATVRLLELATCELNGDMSHYLFRGYTKGPNVARVIDSLGHAHLRLAKSLGDLSAWIEDPKADWQSKGVTWQLFQFMLPALRKGLSSRTLVGETGPVHAVADPLTLDAKLLPLWRSMARVADAGAQGITIKVDEPGDLKPWG